MKAVPDAVVPPKGLAGLIEGYDANAKLDISSFPPNMVFLNIYDVSENEVLQAINRWTTANNNVLVGGVFHAGVEVFGEEWCYGFAPDRSGVAAVAPRSHPQHTYRSTVPMGTTDLDEQEVRRLLRRMAAEWPGQEYDLFHHNCLTFCNALLQELGLRRIPGWVDRAARAASAVDQAVHLVRSATADLKDRARDLVDDDAAEALTSLRRQSLQAVTEVAQTQSKAAQEIAAVVATQTEESVQTVRETLRQWTSEEQLASNPTAALAVEFGTEIGARTRELTGRLLDSWQASWSLGGGSSSSNVPCAATAGAASGGYGASKAAIATNGWDFLSGVGLGVGSVIGGSVTAPSSSVGNDAGVVASDVDRGTTGLVRAQEDGFLTRSLLDDTDDVSDDARKFQRASAPPLAARGLEDEAPAEWLSSSPVSVERVGASGPPPLLPTSAAPVATQAVDLLG